MLRTALLAALALLLPAPALADVTAHYAAGNQTVTVEAADDGSWRIDVANMGSVIRHDGVDYVVLAIPGVADKALVTRLDDLLGLAGGSAKIGDTDLVMDLLPGEGAEVAGYKGTGWLLGPHGDGSADKGGDKPVAFVMSDAPDLAPIGNVFRHLVGVLVTALKPHFTAAGNAPDQVAALFAKGTPIRVADKFVLASVDTAKLDPKQFDLPAEAVAPADFLAALRPKEEPKTVEDVPVPAPSPPAGH